MWEAKVRRRLVQVIQGDEDDDEITKQNLTPPFSFRSFGCESRSAAKECRALLLRHSYVLIFIVSVNTLSSGRV